MAKKKKLLKVPAWKKNLGIRCYSGGGYKSRGKSDWRNILRSMKCYGPKWLLADQLQGDKKQWEQYAKDLSDELKLKGQSFSIKYLKQAIGKRPASLKKGIPEIPNLDPEIFEPMDYFEFEDFQRRINMIPTNVAIVSNSVFKTGSEGNPCIEGRTSLDYSLIQDWVDKNNRLNVPRISGGAFLMAIEKDPKTGEITWNPKLQRFELWLNEIDNRSQRLIKTEGEGEEELIDSAKEEEEGKAEIPKKEDDKPKKKAKKKKAKKKAKKKKPPSKSAAEIKKEKDVEGFNTEYKGLLDLAKSGFYTKDEFKAEVIALRKAYGMGV